MEPVFSAVLAWLWLRQALSPLQICGGVLVIAAVYSYNDAPPKITSRQRPNWNSPGHAPDGSVPTLNSWLRRATGFILRLAAFTCYQPRGSPPRHPFRRSYPHQLRQVAGHSTACGPPLPPDRTDGIRDVIL
ncbi:hypothetical protein [Actinoplanes siamensis]|uniref:hypothetical protein n=1 Tax=Actinoplanes siamensis TaxID=1223317 RepID=UPI0036070DA2